jgi:hypothetical protein
LGAFCSRTWPLTVTRRAMMLEQVQQWNSIEYERADIEPYLLPPSDDDQLQEEQAEGPAVRYLP